jgi:putative thioredoxin
MTNAPMGGANLRGAVDLSSLVRPAAPAPGSTGSPAAASSGVVRSSTDATFTQVLDLSSTVRASSHPSPRSYRSTAAVSCW